MECIIQSVRGSSLSVSGKQCSFCGDEAECMFGITDGTKHDGTIFKGFGVCKEHKEKLNALLSGEFDIDLIFLERFRRTPSKKVNLRLMPPVIVARTNNLKMWKSCEFVGCTNKFYGIAVQKYCNDKRCMVIRKQATKTRGRKQTKDEDVSNLVIERKLNPHIKNNQTLKIRCRARDKDNCKCSNSFFITYVNNRKVYPKFCEEHRSAHKRKIFSQRGKNA